MARIPLGTSGGTMSQVALQLESENRADERQKRQIHAQQAQFFSSLMQRQAQDESRLAFDENAQALDAMQNQLREEGLRKHRAFQQATTNIKTGAEYGQQVGWNPATKQFEAKPVEAGQGFEIAKTKKAREKAEALAGQVQARQALALATAPGLAIFDPEFEAYRSSLVNSSMTDSQMVTRIQEYEKEKIRSLVDQTMRDPKASPEEKASAMSALWESGQETPHETAIESLAKERYKSQSEPGYGEKQAEKASAVYDKEIQRLEAEISLPPWLKDPTMFGGWQPLDRKSYMDARKASIKVAQKRKKEIASAMVEMAKKREANARSFPQIYLDLTTEGVPEVEARVQEYMAGGQQAIQGLQQMAQAGMSAGQGVAEGVAAGAPQGMQQGQQPPLDTTGQPSGPPGGQTLMGEPLEPGNFGQPQDATVIPDKDEINQSLEAAGPEAKRQFMDLITQLEKALAVGDSQAGQKATMEIMDLLQRIKVQR